jgi:hypothetical protein
MSHTVSDFILQRYSFLISDLISLLNGQNIKMNSSIVDNNYYSLLREERARVLRDYSNLFWIPAVITT